MREYFEEIREGVLKAFEVAKKARKLGIDPSDDVEIIAAEDMAARVEGLVGPKGVADRIRELKKSMERERIAFEIVREIVEGRFGKFDMEKAADLALRCSLAILTEGITAAPLEGIAEVKIKKNMDGSSYLAIYYAGPIRSAGGTETAQTVLLGDYVRSLLGLDVYKPDKEEIERYVEEVELYERRVTHLQYSADREEIEFAASHLPIEITGEPTHQYEVSGHRDLPRVETNRIRGGAVLVLVEGVIGRAHKLLKIVDEMGLKGWDWLKDLIKIKEKKKGSGEGGDEKDKNSIVPNSKYLSDVIAGRPVFSHPSAFGGFRLRYGRSRNTGLAAAGLNPATMYILDEFIAVGTHIRMERPGKGAIITPVTTIEGPVVKLKDGSVVKVNDVKTAKMVKDDVERILFLGDILIAYGEFLENNHPLVPSGYVEEWWAEDLRDSIEKKFDGNLSEVSNLLNIEEDVLERYLEEPLKFYPSPKEAVSISLKLGVPLHPRYTYFWSRINSKDLIYFFDKISESDSDYDYGKSLRVRYDGRLKEIMEKICLPHRMGSGYIELPQEDSYVIYTMLKSMKDLSKNPEFDGNALDFINEYCLIKVRKKGATFIGARMGRPEKAKERKMKPPVHMLFPTGGGGGRIRDFAKLKDKGKIKTEVKTYYCERCGEITFSRVCPFCRGNTKAVRVCPNCGEMYRKGERCPRCGTPLHDYSDVSIDMNKLWKVLSERIKPPIPKSVKGVIKLMSGERVPEPLEKGFIRAKYGLFVNKDGTIRFDSTDAPLTHFKPKEIGTSVEKLRELGYTHDYEGNELKDEEQIVELKVQDVILPMSAGKYLLKVSKFVDETLETLYGLSPFYNAKRVEDLTGHLIVGLAPHISAGIVGRIIGFTKASVCYAHPYWHAAKRRNCLVGDEEIILLDKNDNVKVVKIRDVEKINLDEYFVFSVSEDGKIVKRRLKGFVKLKSPNYLYRIITDTGRRIEVTPDHRMLVLEDGKIRLVEAKDLREGDTLLAIAEFKNKGIEEINLLEYYSSKKNDEIMVHNVKGKILDEMRRRNMSYRDLVRLSKLNIQYERFWHYINEDSIPLNILDKLSKVIDLPTEGLHISYGGSGARIPAILKLSRELGFLVGLYLANGYAMTDFEKSEEISYQVSWTTSQEETAKFVRETCEKILGRKPSILFRDGAYTITLSGRLYHEIFTEVLGLKGHAGGKRADRLINFSKEFIKGVISGLIEGDGSVEKSVVIKSRSRELINDLLLLSISIGLFPHVEIEGGGTDEKTFYKLRFYSEDLMKLIDISTGVKKKSLENIIENVILVDGGIRKFGDFVAVKVRKIERFESEEKYVYDLEIEGEKTFIAGLGWLATYDCDGDEDSVILLLDALLNFSRSYLPSKRGGFMDAPLILTVNLNPSEVDDESWNMDVSSRYPKEFYEMTENLEDPKKPFEFVDVVEKRLGKPEQYYGFKFTHDTERIDMGPLSTSYKKFKTMQEKVEAQLKLASEINAVDERDVANKILISHFLPDIFGSFRSFMTQSFRCINCNKKYRRVPLSGKCPSCGGKLVLTVSEGTVTKYLDITKNIINKYDLDEYLKQRIEMIEYYINSIFNKGRKEGEVSSKKQIKLSDFL